MSARNRVIAGDYLDYTVYDASSGQVCISSGSKSIVLAKTIVERYEIVDEERRKSAASAVGRGLVGSLLLGPVGWLAGLSAKTKGVYLIAVQFRDGEKSLLEIDDRIYKALITTLF
jgi:hypothetical protein